MTDLQAKELLANQLRRAASAWKVGQAPNDLLDRLDAAEQALASARQLQGPDDDATVLTTEGPPSRMLSAETTGLEATVSLRMRQVPTSIVHLLDPGETPLVTCTVRNTRDNPKVRRVRVTSFVEGYSAKAIETIDLTYGKDASTFSQLPTFFPDRIQTLHEMTRATLNVKVEDLDNGKIELHKTSHIWLMPPTTAVLSMKDPDTGKWKDLTPWLASYVTPNEPSVLNFLRSAALLSSVGKLSGYQEPRSGVPEQVKALFLSLKQNSGMRYVNSTVAYSLESSTVVQRVRLPRESLADKVANCLDGAVLFASLLEAASFNPGIAIVPGHALVAWETWGFSDEWSCLETTEIADADFDKACGDAANLVKRYAPAGLKSGLPPPPAGSEALRFCCVRAARTSGSARVLPMG
jgi:hypothetical protein